MILSKTMYKKPYRRVFGEFSAKNFGVLKVVSLNKL